MIDKLALAIPCRSARYWLPLAQRNECQQRQISCPMCIGPSPRTSVTIRGRSHFPRAPFPALHHALFFFFLLLLFFLFSFFFPVLSPRLCDLPPPSASPFISLRRFIPVFFPDHRFTPSAGILSSRSQDPPPPLLQGAAITSCVVILSRITRL